MGLANAVVQATISTLGNRILEVVLPASSDKKEVSRITNEVREIIEQKTGLRERCAWLIDNSI
jgi:type I restriction enzyme M protein